MQRRILVVRFGSLGDVVLTSATVLNLKLAYPDSHLVYLTKDRFRSVVALFDGVDEIVTVPDRVSARALFTRSLDLDCRDFDIVADLHGNFRSWLVRSVVSANQKLIYPKRRLERRQTTRRKKELPTEYPHTIDLYNEILEPLSSIAPCRRPLLRPPPLADNYKHLFDADHRVVLIAPGAAHLNKAWPIERFVELVRLLRERARLRVVWAVTSAEQKAENGIAPVNDPEVHELVDCDLDQLAAIAGRCDLAIVNDSGVGHLASAAGTPVAAIFGPTHPVLGFAPRGLRDRVVEVDESCRPCSIHGRKECYRDERYCFTRITAADVAETASEMLNETDQLTPALFVDRDGTLIVDRHYLSDPNGVELIDGTVEALQSARASGYKIVIVSNQSGVAKGYHTRDAVERVNGRLLELLAAERVRVDGVYYCPHHYRRGRVPEYTLACDCRKPAPGMAERAALDLWIDLRRSVVVGDSTVDMALGRVIGGRSVLVRTGYGTTVEHGIKETLEPDSVSVVDDLSRAVISLSAAGAKD